MLTLLTFKMTSSQYFGNISVQISPNNNKLDIFEIYTKRSVGKCLRWTFLTLREPRKSINKSGNSFGEHPVLLHIFKIKDQKQNKQGLRRTWKLRQCTNWKENLRICELAKASNKENWSVQLIRPADPSSWFVQLIRPADPSSWSVQLICPVGLSSWSVQLVHPAGTSSWSV